ncbi:restriction endonuclease subunit S [Flavobacterium ranwuense]|nr:restriction endonuclease subunit S [Flavobacterium ranwuense]
MEKLKKTPTLRFPEFKGEWELKKLGKITEKVNSGKTPLGGESVYVEKGILFIRSQNVLDSKLSFENSTFITEKINNTMKNSVVKANDILLNITGASLGRSCVVPNNFTVGNVNQHVCIIRLNKENEPYFIQPIFSSEKGQNIFTSLQTGSGREGLNFQSIRSMSLAFPTLPEQQKIATFLTKVDEKLQALKQKKSLLEQYKKGVMQKIFSPNPDSLDLKDEKDFDNSIQQKSGQSGKSHKSRFRQDNGNAFADWEEKKLGECLDYLQPTKYLVSSTEYDNSFATPVLTAGKTFILGYTNETNGIFENNLPVIIFDDFTTATQFVDFPFKAKSSAMKILVAREGIDIKFIYEAMQIMNYEIGGHERHWISKFAPIDILIPCLEEQTKIATFLSTIDDKINHCQAQLTNTEVWKKGLLQGMFV